MAFNRINLIKLLNMLCNIFLLIFSTHAICQTQASLQDERINVMKKYVKLLGEGDYHAIPKLFVEKGYVVSSTGAVDESHHFYKTLLTKTISMPQSKFINIFVGKMNENMMASYFDYSWENIHGNRVAAKFLDLFIFEDKSSKIKRIFIFSNTFKAEIMKQLE